ncbi:MAG TPA: hypothetical protein VKR06_09180 [Ktedonosporobacter sp.]|nr:hypothetical protein [Ktedonosporobacter sp.]
MTYVSTRFSAKVSKAVDILCYNQAKTLILTGIARKDLTADKGKQQEEMVHLLVYAQAVLQAVQ